jgi:YggT family protein
MVTGLLSAIIFLLGVLGVVIFVQVVLSWLIVFNVINTHNDFVRNFLRALDYITEPLYRPIRKILPDFGGIDFSPLVVLIAIQALRILLGDLTQSLYLSG